ncbi:probable serine/threonine-protein kinase DDB_G0281745 [Xenopus laevis]|uniref:Probable serine/threonine-protein kinase DDB_G0281745 n=1 Tax=Xenopus laevis TaxID=8355 RepID=A0A8J1LUM4_XENLA|nr:probable serine/threonine-protein kinase DDB_G0281745 [Xenopus laevis]
MVQPEENVLILLENSLLNPIQNSQDPANQQSSHVIKDTVQNNSSTEDFNLTKSSPKRMKDYYCKKPDLFIFDQPASESNFDMQSCGGLSKDLSASNIFEENIEDHSTPPIPTKSLAFNHRLPFVAAEKIKYSENTILGRGNYGTVYKGYFLDTPAAVKIIQSVQSLDHIQEIKVCLTMSHPNIVRLMAVGQRENDILLANEFIHGDTLQKVINSPKCPIKLSFEEKAFVGIDMSLAIQYIHERKIIHQDIKPANVMITFLNKKAILTDWGLAHMKDSVSLNMGSHMSRTIFPQNGGTPLYMSPECQIQYEAATYQSDIWSFGILLVELFSGKCAWNVKDMISFNRLLSRKTQPHGLADVPASVKEIVTCCVKYNRYERPSATQVVRFLKKIPNLDFCNHYGYMW